MTNWWEGYQNGRSHPQRGKGPSSKLVDLNQKVESSIHLALKRSEAGIWESQRPVGNPGCALFESWHRGSSSKSNKVIHEGDTLTNFRVYARGTGICWNFLKSEVSVGTVFLLSLTYLMWHWHAPHMTLSMNLAKTFHPTLAFPRDSPNIAPLQSTFCPAALSGWAHSSPAHSRGSATAGLGLAASHIKGLPCTPVSLQQLWPGLTTGNRARASLKKHQATEQIKKITTYTAYMRL